MVLFQKPIAMDLDVLSRPVAGVRNDVWVTRRSAGGLPIGILHCVANIIFDHGSQGIVENSGTDDVIGDPETRPVS
jgi:hypothetical protein